MNTNTFTKHLFTIDEVSRVLIIPKRTINNLVSQNRFPKPLSVNPSLHYWTYSDLEKWVNTKP
jgi:predicted DNA-binding transcriptional regulator AlpA